MGSSKQKELNQKRSFGVAKVCFNSDDWKEMERGQRSCTNFSFEHSILVLDVLPK